MLAAQAPFAEVFAVITQDSVAVLAHSGPSTANHLTTIEMRRLIRSSPHTVTVHETSQRNLLDGPSTQAACKSGVVHYLTTPHVDSMMQIAATRSHYVRTQRRFTPNSQRPLRLV